MKPEVLKYDFKQRADDSSNLELYIYSDVAADSYDWWSGETIESETSASYFRDKLEEYKDVTNITLYINSFGGSVKEGYGIYSQLMRHPAKKTVYVDGFACSISSIIAMCGDTVKMAMGSMMGIHNMMSGVFGNASEHRKAAEDLDRMMEGNRQIYMQRIGDKISLEKLTELLDNETMLTAQECLEYGLCDEIVGVVKEPEKATQMMQRMNANMAAQAKFYTQLKQAFNEAVGVSHSEKPAPNQTTPLATDPKPKPQENTLSAFMNALTAH